MMSSAAAEMPWLVKVCLVRGRPEEIVVCAADRSSLVDWEDVNAFC